jgi:hypothetical protein
MGKKHRRIRTQIKSELRRQGWREDEFGELKRRMTKGDARRHLLGQRLFFLQTEREIMDIAVEKARQEILEEEDKRIFQEILSCGDV